MKGLQVSETSEWPIYPIVRDNPALDTIFSGPCLKGYSGVNLIHGLTHRDTE